MTYIEVMYTRLDSAGKMGKLTFFLKVTKQQLIDNSRAALTRLATEPN